MPNISGIQLMQRFWKRFVVKQDGSLRDMPILISVDRFDKLGITIGFYPQSQERDTILQSRYRMRTRINKTARSHRWKIQGGMPIDLAVKDIGKTMVVNASPQGYEYRAARLGKGVRGSFRTKRSLLRDLFRTIDLPNQPQMLQARLTLFEKDLDHCEQRMISESLWITQRFRDYQQVLSDVQNIPGAAALIANLAQTFADNGDESPEEE